MRAADTIGIVVNQSGDSGTNEIQRLTHGGATTGTCDINGNSQTATLDWTGSEGGTPPNLAACMDTLWGSGNYSLSGGAGYSTITFQGSFGVQPIAEMTLSNNSTDGSPAMSTDLQGATGQHHIITVTLSDSPTEGKCGVQASSIQWGDYWDFDATTGEVEAALESGGSPFACTVSGSTGGPWQIESDVNSFYEAVGIEDAGNPLRKSLGIEIVTLQEGEPDEGPPSASTLMSHPAIFW